MNPLLRIVCLLNGEQNPNPKAGHFREAGQYISDMNGENALRGMLENARQGFVNGKVPYGYRAVETERRADKRKMAMEIEPHRHDGLEPNF